MSSSGNSGRELDLVLVGLVQGLVLYGLYRVYDANLWPVSYSPLFNALLAGALFYPLCYFWTAHILAPAKRLRVCIVVTIGAVLLGMYHGFTAFPDHDGKRLAVATAHSFFGYVIATFIVIPLTNGRIRGGETPAPVLRFWEYERLFNDSWRNAVLSIQALVLTCLFWGILEVGAQLFHLIGIDWIRDELLHKSWFSIPATTTSFALAFRAGLRRTDFAVTLRNHWLAITAWLLVTVSVIGALFVFSAVGGVADLFGRGLSAFFLLWFVAFWVTFFNSAFQAGEPDAAPFGNRLKRLLSWATLPMLVMVAFAAYALTVRIRQHGLTPDRVWGMLVVFAALIYGVGYSATLVRRRHSGWMSSIPATNVMASIVVCAGVVLYLSPALDPRRISVSNQMARLASGTVAAEKLDMDMLARSGRFGYDQLVQQAAQRGKDGYSTDNALRAQAALARERYRYADGQKHAELATDLLQRLEVFPPGTALPEGLQETIIANVRKWDAWRAGRSCFAAASRTQCALLVVDLNGDRAPETIMWEESDFQYTQPHMFTMTGKEWKHVGQMHVLHYGKENEIRGMLRRGEFSVVRPSWRELRVGEQTMIVAPTVESPTTGCNDATKSSAKADSAHC
jgi:hypothetical protein